MMGCKKRSTITQMRNKELKDRIIEISRKHGLSHLGSCLTAVDIIADIYEAMVVKDKFVLSCGHAGLALYVVLERYGYDAEKLLHDCGIHPTKTDGIDCSTGSLGQGLPIALGMAMADRSKDVYCLISDGECSEGSIWETANVMRKYDVKNLKVFLNFNGWGAYDAIQESLKDIMKVIIPGIIIYDTNFDDFPFLNGQDAHYCTLPKE